MIYRSQCEGLENLTSSQFCGIWWISKSARTYSIHKKQQQQQAVINYNYLLMLTDSNIFLLSNPPPQQKGKIAKNYGHHKLKLKIISDYDKALSGSLLYDNGVEVGHSIVRKQHFLPYHTTVVRWMYGMYVVSCPVVCYVGTLNRSTG